MLHRLLSPWPALGLSVALVALAAAVPTAAHAFSIEFVGGSGPRVEGSGTVVEQTRTVGPFTRLRLDGSFTVEAQAAASNSVLVRADDNIGPLVRTELEGDTLVVSTRPGASFRTRHPVVVRVGFTRLVSAELRGSGDLVINGITGDRFDAALAGSGDLKLTQVSLGSLAASLAGSGDLTAQGKAGEVKLNIAGSGDAHLDNLQAKRGSVSVAGSGDARVNASEAMDVQIVGSGEVWVGGNPPKLTQQVMGSGEVHRTR